MIEDWYNEEFIPQAVTKTKDGAGAFNETYADVTSKKFLGRLEFLNSNSYVQNLAKAYSAQHLIIASCDNEANLLREMILKSATSGKEYEILEIDNLYNHHLEIKVGE